jgi:predicted nuclease of restriction endonuclease-like (RecB) superfamily
MTEKEIVKPQDNNTQETVRINALFEKIAILIERSRRFVANSVNMAEVRTRYEVGRYIYEDEQQGGRASYGKQVLKNLSARLISRYGEDWTYDTLKRCRFFYQAYANAKIGATPLPQLEDYNNPSENKQDTNWSNTVAPIQLPRFTLSWSHYLVLMRIENIEARSFYEIEAAQQQWSVKQLARQVGSSLYERLALSRNKDEVMRLALEGQTVEKPSDVIKNPITLEFLGLKPDELYTETKLENAIISKLQQFLLELGKGFLFEKRQKRFTFDEENYYVDLVFYNRLLQCYVLIDLKTDKLTHQDLGQMQMYVNYYDRYVKQDYETPTIGILLCESKKDALVELTLPKDANIYATAYQLYLPDKALLQAKLKEWIEEYNEIHNEEK